MCGRARCTLNPQDVARACHINDSALRTHQIERYRPSYNVLPGSHLPVVRKEDASSGDAAPAIHCMKWGLIPSFTKKNEKPDHFKMFNARSESLSEKPAFRRLLPNNRCLVAVEGFYEWKKDGSRKQPYYIHFKDQRPLVFPALYDSWKNSEGEIIYTFTILTTRCSSLLQWLHDRMPVILGNEGSIDAWLSGSPSTKFQQLLQPYEDPDLVWYPVTTEMGKLSFNGPECIKEIQLKTEEQSISKFFLKNKIEKKDEKEPEVKETSEVSTFSSAVKCVKEEQCTEENKQQTGFCQIRDKGNNEIEKKDETEPEVKVAPKASTFNDGVKNVKEEPCTEESKQHTGFSQNNSVVFPLHTEEDEKRGIKRELEQFETLRNEGDEKSGIKKEFNKVEADMTPPTDKTKKTRLDSSKKKWNAAGDGQSTLPSYFGRK